MAIIKSVSPDSGFYRLIKPGDRLLTIEGREITDCFDIMYYFEDCFTSEAGKPVSRTLSVGVERNGVRHLFKAKSAKGSLGMEFDSFLMDGQRSCKNKCCFCFIDQMPPKMRETLYYKDDDYRLSLIYGNYVTLTNADRKDINRIKELHLSPLNISVHTTDPELRIKMMKNPNAGGILDILKELAEAGIRLKAQIVLCPGINDGEALIKTLTDLKALTPSVSSVSVVPVGLTKFREGLTQLKPFDKDSAAAAIDIITDFADRTFKESGTHVFYAADEFYLKAERQRPDADYYENFEQIENGVGMLSKYAEDLAELLPELKENDKKISCSMLTGYAAAPFFEKEALPALKTKLPGLECRVWPIRNDYFGEMITVAGLITGQDIIKQLKGKPLGDFLIIPTVMLRDGAFLDDVTVKEAEKELAVKVICGGPSPEDLYSSLISE